MTETLPSCLSPRRTCWTDCPENVSTELVQKNTVPATKEPEPEPELDAELLALAKKLQALEQLGLYEFQSMMRLHVFIAELGTTVPVRQFPYNSIEEYFQATDAWLFVITHLSRIYP